MIQEAELLLNAITAYNKAHVGDSDSAEIDAALEMEDAALTVLRTVAAADAKVAQLLNKFDRNAVLSNPDNSRLLPSD